MKNEHSQHSTDFEKFFEKNVEKKVVSYRACTVRTFESACTARTSSQVLYVLLVLELIQFR